jgi:hypothetical protein
MDAPSTVDATILLNAPLTREPEPEGLADLEAGEEDMQVLGDGTLVRPQVVVVAEEALIASAAMELRLEAQDLGVAGLLSEHGLGIVLPQLLGVAEHVERVALVEVPGESSAVRQRGPEVLDSGDARDRARSRSDLRVREAQERLQACSYAMAHPDEGWLVPACVQHGVFDPRENLGLQQVLPLTVGAARGGS